MIRKQDILDRAFEWRLRPDVVEKDYVLGWLLAAIAASPVRPIWIFKGGTCIKKCYVETYRFSEDLDFSLLPDAPYTVDELRAALLQITALAHEMSGIEFPAEHVEVREQRNLQGGRTFQGRVGYRGPLVYPGYPRVIFDITHHEPVLEPAAEREILHPYPDVPDALPTVLAYSFMELLAEKTRALFERSRPRDLYDVVFLLDNHTNDVVPFSLRALFSRKCGVKSIATPTKAALLGAVRAAEELRSEWGNMLAHQLPQLPDVDASLGRLPELLAWVDAPEVAAAPPQVRLGPVPVHAGSAAVAPAGIRAWGAGSPVETVRFAAASHLLVEFDYDGKDRRAEPYSLRRADTGNLLLYAWELESDHIKAFNVEKIRNVRATTTAFAPRYSIELSGSTLLSVPRPPRPRPLAAMRPRRPNPRPRSTTRSGPAYVFECTYCRKRFTHSTNDPALRAHKSASGFGKCAGRRGYLVDRRY